MMAHESAIGPVFGEKMFLVILAVVCGRDAVVVIYNMNVFF